MFINFGVILGIQHALALIYDKITNGVELQSCKRIVRELRLVLQSNLPNNSQP